MGKPETNKSMGDYKKTLETFYSEKQRERISVGDKGEVGGGTSLEEDRAIRVEGRKSR